MKIKSVKHNFVMNFILTASSIIFPFITMPYVTRVLTADGVGRLNIATANVAYFCMVASLGIPTYGIRACARVRDNKAELSKTVQELLLLNTVTTVIVSAAFVTSLFLIPQYAEERTLFLISGLTLWLNVIGVSWLYSALEQYSYITIRSLIFKVISILLMFLLVRKRSDYIVYGAILVLAAAGSNILNFINMRKFVTLKRVGELDVTRHLKPVMIFFATSAATSVYTNLDAIMLGFITGNKAANGYYDVSTKIKIVLVSLVTSLGVVLLPRLSYYIQQGNKEEFRRVVVKAFNFVLILATGLMIYFIVFAKDSVLLISGSGFLGSVLPMQLLMPTVLFIGLTNVMGIQILVPMGRERQVLHSILWGAAANFILNLILIPRWQAAGTAFSTLAAELIVLIVQSCYLHDEVLSILKQLSLKQIFISAAVGTALALFLHHTLSFHPFFNLLFSAVAFFAVYFGLLLLQKEPFIMDSMVPIFQRFLKKKRLLKK